MQFRSILKPGFLGLSMFVLVSCEEGFGLTDSGFRNQYMVARLALEEGNYPRATRAYAQLLSKSGPLAPRIRLEYAHSLLRGGDYAGATQEARSLTASQTGTARAAALAVEATALHEQGLVAINTGDAAAGKRQLQAAKTAIDEVLKDHPELDPLGALAGRRASIKVQLKAL